MPKNISPLRIRFDRIHHQLDRLLYGLSIYALPLLIGLISFVALIGWKSIYQTAPAKLLEFRAVQEMGVVFTPANALLQLQAQTPVRHYDTHLSETPIWFTFVADAASGDVPLAAELPSRHAVGTECWDAKTLQHLGRAAVFQR
jgi:hypothetical protein